MVFLIYEPLSSHRNKKVNFFSLDESASGVGDPHLPTYFKNLHFSSISTKIDCNNGTDNSCVYATVHIEPYNGIWTNLIGKVYTGAEGNLLLLRVFSKLYPSHISSQGKPVNLVSSKTTLSADGGPEIPHFGTISLPCSYKNSNVILATFYVTDVPGPVIFGYRTCSDLGLGKMNCTIYENHTLNVAKSINSVSDLQQKYPKQFKGIGKFAGFHKLPLQENAQSVIHPPRKSPIQLRGKINAELDRMVELDVICPVNELTDWVSSIIYVQKADGNLRICLDPRDLNKALRRGQHHIPTIEELTYKFAGAKILSKLDAKTGYWSVQLDPSSQLLTTFNTPFGRFCDKRLPFDLETSQDVFQQAMDQILDGL